MASEAASFTSSPATVPDSSSRATLALSNVRYEKKGSVAYVTVDRPKVLNALNTPTWTDLHAAFEEVAHECAGTEPSPFIERPTEATGKRRNNQRRVGDSAPDHHVGAGL